MNGILLVDKPVGCTSHDVVQLVRKLVRPEKVGHSGTLDPAASGLLILAIGSATRAIEFLDDTRKTYVMTIHLGEETDTWDGEGQVVSVADASNVSLEEIQEVLPRYLGVVRQTPPHFSALKKNGIPLYKLARKGVFPSLEPREVEIFSLEIISWNNPLLALRMSCSRGAYARSVARDVGRELGVGGRLDSLRRTNSGPYDVQHAVGVNQIAVMGDEILAEKLMTLKQALAHIPTLSLTPSEIGRLLNGSVVLRKWGEVEGSQGPCWRSGSFFKALTSLEDYLIITVLEGHNDTFVIRPKKVLKVAS